MSEVMAVLERAAKALVDATHFATDCACRPAVLAGTAELVRESIDTIQHCLAAIQDAVATDRDGRERQRSRMDRMAPGNHG